MGWIKRLFADKAKISDIIKEFPTPFHLYDERGIREKVRQLYDAFSWNPGFHEFFAVKATPNPAILRILKEEGCGADCSSYTELLLSKAVGIMGRDIMFSSNTTPARDYKLASDLGAIINLDDYTHIDFLNKICGIPKTICCRYNPGGMFRASTHVMDNPGDAKFGFTKEQLFEGFRKLRGLGAERFGIHAFLASNANGNIYYPDLAKVLFELAVELARGTGADIRFINLSGGIGLPYHPDDPPIDIAAIGAAVKKAYEDTLAPAGLGDVALFTELGRYMLGDSGALITTVVHEKHIYKEYIGVDASASNLLRPAMYKAYHHITVMGKEDINTAEVAEGAASAGAAEVAEGAVSAEAAEVAECAGLAEAAGVAECAEPAEAAQIYDVTGSLCENNDKFAIDRVLPRINIGDILWIHDTGAHGHSMGYNYNGSLRSAEILLHEDGSFELIRRAETPRDYFATLVDPNVMRTVDEIK